MRKSTETILVTAINAAWVLVYGLKVKEGVELIKRERKEEKSNK